MNKEFYFLSPVEVVKVTSQNLEEVAEWCGGSVQETESRRVPGRMDKYVLVPTPKDSNISWAFPGMFITKRLVVTVKDEIRETYAVFRRDYFEKNYFSTPKDAADKTWERQLEEKNNPKKKDVKVSSNVGEALVEAQQRVKELEEELLKKEASEELDHQIEVAEKQADKEIEVNRSAETGQFVSDEVAEENPATTVTETVKLPADASLA
jgi:hypothetical protein